MAGTASETSPLPAGGAVFLSYARENADAARRIADALRGFGVEAWFDQSELRGGDSWDQKIRRQIKDCTLFIPIISAHTQARGEGYFRLEWKLAAERTHLMAEGVPFLAPVVVDDTPDAAAAVPPEFLRVQWTRLPGGAPTPEFVAQIKRLLAAPKTAFSQGAPASSRQELSMAGKMPALLSGAPQRVGRRVPAAAWIAVVVVLAMGGAAWWKISAPSPSGAANAGAGTRPPTPEKPAAPDPKSVAVLAFENLSADKDNEYFSDGLSENILDKLARMPGLRVMARTSSFSYKGRNVPVQQIASELHVGTVIEGSVQRAGNKLRVVAQLINAADGMHVWSETYDRELTTTDIFAMQDEIALKIAARLAPNSAPAAATVAAAPTKNLEAYEAYLRGRSFQTRGRAFSPDAKREYQRAVALDPQFALAWAQLGRVQGSGTGFTEAAEAKAWQAIDQARRWGGDFFETHLTSASLYISRRKYDLAEKELEQADRLRPDDADTLSSRGSMDVYRGHWDEGIRLLRRATERDPQNGATASLLGGLLLMVGRYAEAETAFDHAFSLTGSDAELIAKATTYFRWKGDGSLALKTLDGVPVGIRSERYWRARWQLLRDLGDFAGALAAIDQMQADVIGSIEPKALLRALTLESQGDRAGGGRAYQEALPKAERLRADNPQTFVIFLPLAQIYVGLGRKEEAFATLAEAMKLANGAPNATARVNEIVAQADAHFGMIDEAIELAKTQIATGWWKRNNLLLGADWAELRKDPRFRALAEQAPL